MNVELFANRKRLNVDRYDRTIDPSKHMYIIADDAIFCNDLPTDWDPYVITYKFFINKIRR